MKYAKNTDVTVEESQNEIQYLLKKYGASKFAIDWQKNAVLFELNHRSAKLQIKYPDRKNFEKTEKGQQRSSSMIIAAIEKAKMQCWRILVLMLKANLEAIDSGIFTIDQVFLPFYLLPTGQTIAEQVLPQLQRNELPLLPRNVLGDEKND